MSLCHNANHQFFAISYEAAISIDLVELFSNVLILVRGLYYILIIIITSMRIKIWVFNQHQKVRKY